VYIPIDERNVTYSRKTDNCQFLNCIILLLLSSIYDLIQNFAMQTVSDIWSLKYFDLKTYLLQNIAYFHCIKYYALKLLRIEIVGTDEYILHQLK
jgi:hypothetical protein